MAGTGPAIHLFEPPARIKNIVSHNLLQAEVVLGLSLKWRGVDGRDKPGHDGGA